MCIYIYREREIETERYYVYMYIHIYIYTHTHVYTYVCIDAYIIVYYVCVLCVLHCIIMLCLRIGLCN